MASAEIYEGATETVALPRKYGAIFVGTGSFQLVSCPRAALENLRRHLLPGGLLLVEVWIPWEVIETGEVDSSSTTVDLGNGEVIRLENHCRVEQEQQRLCNEMLFTRIREGQEVEQEREELILRWHYQVEMELLLERAGFETIGRVVPSKPYVPHSTLYRAS